MIINESFVGRRSREEVAISDTGIDADAASTFTFTSDTRSELSFISLHEQATAERIINRPVTDFMFLKACTVLNFFVLMEYRCLLHFLLRQISHRQRVFLVPAKHRRVQRITGRHANVADGSIHSVDMVYFSVRCKA